MHKQNVLKKNWEFQDVINSRRQFVSKDLIVYYRRNKLNLMQIGISVSKKFLGAVGRNYERRQIRSILTAFYSRLSTLGLDIVIIVRKPFLELSFATKTVVLKEMFDKLEKMVNNESSRATKR